MEKEQKQNLLHILKKAQVGLKKGDTRLLRNLSNHLIHDASIFQDEVYLSVAVIIYTLSKIHQRENYQEYSGFENFCNDCYKDLEILHNLLLDEKYDKFETHLKQFLQKINKLDKKFRVTLKEVFRKARVHKASRLHEHGISLGRTAELLGITQFEVQDYVGGTGIADVKENITLGVNERLKLVRSVFK